MFFINFKIAITFIYNSLNRRNRNIISLSNRCKRSILLKFTRNSKFEVIRYIRIIINNISRRRKRLLTILTDVPLNTKIKFNIVTLKWNKFNITFSIAIFNNIFKVTMRARAIVSFKKAFKNLS